VSTTYTFDGATKLIVIDDTGQNPVVGTAKGLYSAWKDWVGVGNPQWAAAFRTIGGDDLGGGVKAGDYYFLQNQDGWRIKPAERNHVLKIDGNLFAETPGTASFALTSGAFNVQIQVQTSSLTQTLAVGSGLDSTQDQALTDAKNAAVLAQKLLRNKLVTDPADGKVKLYDDNGSLLLQADVFEDAAGTVPYRSQGAERRERLT